MPTFASPPAPAVAPAQGGAKGVSAGEMLKFGWHTTWQNFFPIVGLFTLALVVNAVVQVLGGLVLGEILGDLLGSLVAALVSLVITAAITLGIFRIALRWADGERGSVADLFNTFPLVLNYLGATLIFALIMLAGLLLLVFPAVVWGLTFGMYPFAILDKHAGPIEALRISARVSNGAKWDLFGLVCISFVVIYLGLFTLLIGVLVAYPIVTLAWARAYRRLERATPDADQRLVA